MASESTSGLIKKASIASDELSQAEQNQKINTPLIAKLQDYLRKYQPTLETSQIDTLKDRFRIDMTLPVEELDTLQAKAYSASDSTEPSKLLYAHVCEWGKTARYQLIPKLIGLEYRALVAVLAAGSVRLSTTQEERFVIFYERPPGIKVSELIKRKKMPANTAFIIEHILSPLANGIQQFSDLDISHGMVNASNIYISDTALLGPCVSEPSGLNQPYYYESPERMQALPYAKGEGSTAHDYYALAVVLIEILFGDEHLAHYTPESLIEATLSQGSYNALMRDRDVPEIFYDFFRGVLTLNPHERWTGKQVLAWLSGKRFNVLPPPTPVDAVRPFEFGEKLANTRRELAHLFCHDWEHMIAVLNNNQLGHWVSVSLRNKELSDIVGRLSRTAYDLSTKNEMQTYEALSSIIMLLDPSGPIRIKHISVNIDGIDSLCVELYAKKLNPELQILARFVELNMINYWIDLQKKLRKEEYTISTLINAQNIRLDRLRGCIRNSGAGFGLERMLYDLNPEMPCISPLLAAHNVTTLTELLIHLDRIAIQLPDGEDLVDRHIAAFIASKLIILHEIHLDELAGIPSLATSKIIMSIYLLGASQLKAKNLRLPGLTHWLTLKTLPLMDHVHSRTIRGKYKAALMALAPSGFIPKLAELVVSADYANKDQMGFQEAMAKFQHNSSMIRFYQTHENIEVESAKMGYNIAKMVAYICLFGAIYFVSRGL